MKYVYLICIILTEIVLLVNSRKNDNAFLPHLPLVSNILIIPTKFRMYNLCNKLIQFIKIYYVFKCF